MLTLCFFTQEPDTALFLHIGLVNLRGTTSSVTSMLELMGAKHNLCNKYYTTSDGMMTAELSSQLSTHGFQLVLASYLDLGRNGTRQRIDFKKLILFGFDRSDLGTE